MNKSEVTARLQNFYGLNWAQDPAVVREALVRIWYDTHEPDGVSAGAYVLGEGADAVDERAVEFADYWLDVAWINPVDLRAGQPDDPFEGLDPPPNGVHLGRMSKALRVQNDTGVPVEQQGRRR